VFLCTHTHTHTHTHKHKHIKNKHTQAAKRGPPPFPFTLQQLLFPENACLLAESEHFLVKHKHYNALALLYQSKGKGIV
jgi:hypothetical protein